MRQITTRLLFVVVVVIVSGCSTTISQDRSGRDPIKEAKYRLSEVRGLPFKADVPILYESRESLQERLEADLKDELGDRKREDISLAYSKLGVLPAGVDLRSTLLNFYSSRAEGFYNPKTKAIVLVKPENSPVKSGASPAEAIGPRVLVHELTHALQDQHFDIGPKLRASGNSDQALAFRVVAEADAILSEYAYFYGGPSDWLPEYVYQLLANRIAESAFSHVPGMVVDKMLFQYSDAMKFIARTIEEYGWEGLNLIYAHPPVSTEQILHPEKYFVAPDPPTSISLNNLSALFSEKWREIKNDTLGELMVRCLFKQFLSLGEAISAAAGWDGDRFIAYRKGDEVAFVWATSWDSTQDAREFFDAYQTILPMKYESRPFEKERSYIERRDRKVLIVEGLERDFVHGFVDNIWRGMEAEKAAFEPPPLSGRPKTAERRPPLKWTTEDFRPKIDVSMRLTY